MNRGCGFCTKLRSDTSTAKQARLAWSSRVDRRYSQGPAAANGSTGTANPAATPGASNPPPGDA